MNSAGYSAQPVGAVIGAVKTGYHSQQHLGCADVARGFFSADVLLAGLQSQAQSRPPVSVLRNSHQSAGKAALVVFTSGDVGGVRAAEAERHPETLRAAHHRIGARAAGIGNNAQSQQIGGNSHERAAAVSGLGNRSEIAQIATGAGILHQNAEVLLGHFRRVADVHANPQRLGAGRHHCNRLRMAVFIHQKSRSFGFAHP